MATSTIATFAILTTLFLILSSLGYGLFSMLLGTNDGKTVRALSWRIGLSMFLFFSLLVAIHQGWVVPNPPPL